jgi:ATP-binding cassette subfamily B protein
MISIPTHFSIYEEICQSITTIRRAFTLVFSQAPGLTSLNIILVIVQGLLPLATLFVMKLIVDTVTSGVTAVDKTSITTHLLLLLGIAAGIALVLAICRAGANYTNEAQSLVLTDIITGLIQEHSISLDLAYYENPSFQDDLYRAQIEGPARPARIIRDVVQIVQNSISVVAIAGYILSSLPVIGIILICATLPAAVARIWHSRRLYDLTIKKTETERKSRYYHLMMTHRYHAREMRLFGLGPLFRIRYQSLLDSLRFDRLAISTSLAKWEILTQGILTVAIFGSFTIIAMKTIYGAISLGDLVMFFMGFQLCIGYIQTIFSNFNALYEDQLFLRNLYSFLDIKPAVLRPDSPVHVPFPIKNDIRFDNITFTYPGADKPALSNISLTVNKGEIIALVGNNGAGKSTFINLLCRMYEPDLGNISVDGVDLVTMDPEIWRKHITVIFQDYVRYNLTARENIWLGDIDLTPENYRIEDSARKSAAETVIKKLPDTYSSLLGKFFSGGHDLSSGEWQKIALARAFFREAEVVILDEPASSLDAIAEAEIFRRFRELVKGRTAFLISHRFSTVLLADRIVVLDQGKIIESGSHTELLEKNGHYAEMYKAQVDPYF